MWWKLGALALCTAALIAILFMPIHVHIRLPPLPPAARPNATVVYSTPPGVLIVTGALVVAVILGGAALIGARIVRHHRISN
jgi:hypothetical protein